jgi:hypothetical protein
MNRSLRMKKHAIASKQFEDKLADRTHNKAYDK